MRAYALQKKEINAHLIRRTCIRLSILILVGCFFFLEQYSYGLYFSNEIVIDDDTSSLPQEPDIDIQRSVNSKSDNIAYVVWSDNTTGNGDIYFRRSLDNGSLFANIINIAKNNGSSISPQIATAGNGNNMYVVWSDNTTGNGDIYFRRSLDNGDNFDRRKFVSKNNGSSISPQIATAGNGNNVYVVWSDNTTGNGDIYFRRSLDNGSSFETSKNLSNNPGNSSDPHIFVDQKNVYIVWTDATTGNGDIYMKTSSIFEANANNFSRTKNLSRNNGSSISPQIATAGNGNYVYVVWSDNTTGNGDIYFRRSLDNGDNFEGRDWLDENLTRSFNPDIETSGDANIYIVWHSVGSNIRTEVFFRASGDGGLSFDKPVPLTKDSLRSSDTNLVSSQNGLYMIWVEEDSSTTKDGKVNLKKISEDFFDRKQAIP